MVVEKEGRKVTLRSMKRKVILTFMDEQEISGKERCHRCQWERNDFCDM